MKSPRTGWTEADITINGVPLTFGQSMTVRVAIEVMASDLDANRKAYSGALTEGYLKNIDAIRAAIFLNQP